MGKVPLGTEYFPMLGSLDVGPPAWAIQKCPGCDNKLSCSLIISKQAGCATSPCPERAFQTSAAGCCTVAVVAPTRNGSLSNRRRRRPPTGSLHEVHVLESWEAAPDHSTGSTSWRDRISLLLLVIRGQQKLQGAQETHPSLVTGSVTPELGQATARSDHGLLSTRHLPFAPLAKPPPGRPRAPWL